MSLIDDIKKFCKDLIMGDFENEPGNAAMVIGGLISLIPVVDQIMDVRDVAGMLYRINAKGGFKNATPDDCVDLALAAFGCIPEVGSVMKTGIKPLWKKRKKLAKGINAALHSDGIALMERLLHKKPGAVITFLKKDVLGKWASYTQQAITQTDNALTITDQFLGELSRPHWWLPDDLEKLAKDLRPGLQKMRGGIKGAVQSGSNELKQFVVSLIGEDGYRVVATAATVAGSRTPSGHKSSKSNAVTPSKHTSQKSTNKHAKSDPTPIKKNPEADHGKTAEKPRQDVSKGTGKQTNITKPTIANLLEDMSNKLKGILGEHMADYYCQDTKGWGKGTAKHDDAGTVNSHKLNDNGEMVKLFMPKGRGRGIDGVWKSNGSKPYAIIEAKCSENPAKSLSALLGDAGDKNGADVEEGKKSRRGRQNRGGGTQASQKNNSKGGAMDTGGERSRQVNGQVTQMSHNWIITRFKKVKLTREADIIALRRGLNASYSRHVLFFSLPHITAHMNALAMKATGKTVQDQMHAAHEITKEWLDNDIAKVADNRGGLTGSARDKRKR